MESRTVAVSYAGTHITVSTLEIDWNTFHRELGQNIGQSSELSVPPRPIANNEGPNTVPTIKMPESSRRAEVSRSDGPRRLPTTKKYGGKS